MCSGEVIEYCIHLSWSRETGLSVEREERRERGREREYCTYTYMLYMHIRMHMHVFTHTHTDMRYRCAELHPRKMHRQICCTLPHTCGFTQWGSYKENRRLFTGFLSAYTVSPHGSASLLRLCRYCLVRTHTPVLVCICACYLCNTHTILHITAVVPRTEVLASCTCSNSYLVSLLIIICPSTPVILPRLPAEGTETEAE